MTDQHPITPPPELIKQWLWEFYGPESMPGMAPGEMVLHIAAVAARWGADMELEACCEWLDWQKLAKHENLIAYLRAARRPKPPSLKEEALELVDRIEKAKSPWAMSELDTIRRALESLPS